MHHPIPAFALSLLMAGTGCARDLPSASQIEQKLQATLAYGAARPEIEVALAKHGITYSFDRFANRYQGILRSKTSNS